MNRRGFLTGVVGIASAAMGGCTGILGGSSGGWNGEGIEQYRPWMVAPPRNAKADLAYWLRLTDLDRGREIDEESEDLFEAGDWLVPDVTGLDRTNVGRTLQVAVPGRRSRGAFLVCFGTFDTDAVRRAVLQQTSQETRTIGEATMAYDPRWEGWVGIGHDWIVTQGPVVVAAYETERMVELALESIAGEATTMVGRNKTVDGLVDGLSLHHSLDLQYFPAPNSERYGSSEFPSLSLVGETVMERVRGDRYERREDYVFADSAETVERPFDDRVTDQIDKYYDDGSYSVDDDTVTLEFSGPVGSQLE